MILQPSLAKPSPEWSRPHPEEAGPTSPAKAGIRQLLEGRHLGSQQRREDGSLPQPCDFFRGEFLLPTAPSTRGGPQAPKPGPALV
ncbi:hypothetical protein PAL_GLEAN10009932 [Pteropus alecto]|uniref:Uncharacterized protein n=1 Tax=Pteropus alecto TaxID=9402 RepID=L5KE18_PTEAL|nr:hypothetical protein PAL_GLEAN10009932 [Pteropus alecto]